MKQLPIKVITAHIKALDEDVHLRRMSAWDKSTFGIAIQDENKEVTSLNYQCKLLVRVLCDEQGVRTFGDEDHETLGKDYDFAVIDELYEHAAKLNSGEGLDEQKKT